MLLRFALLLTIVVQLLCVAPPARARAADFRPVSCAGQYPQHLQGVCTDGQDFIFWCFTTRLVKTDQAGQVVRQVEVADHHGDLCYDRGKIYVALNLGKFNDPQGHADSWVTVYDAEDLTCLARHKTPEVVHGAGGIAVHEGRFLVVGGLPEAANENLVYEYNAGFEFVAKHQLAGGHTHLGIQTATFARGQWWFGCYGRPRSDTAPANPPILLRADASLRNVARFEFDCSLGIVPVGEGRFLVARGGSASGDSHTGRLVLAVPDPQRGLRLLEQP
ncbi:MAG: hypothetical protein ACKOGA_04150 [Planctomycetaceae bacterium]